jgi:hypothetical protein
MNPNYGTGVYESVITVGILELGFCGFALWVILKGVSDLGETVLFIFVVLFFTVLISLGCFAIIFPITNIILQHWNTTEHKQLLKEELSNGILLVRVTSVYLGVKAFFIMFYEFTFIKILMDKLPHKLAFIVRYLIGFLTRVRMTGYTEIDNLPYHIPESMLVLYITFQYFYYLLVITVIWLFAAHNIHTTYTFFVNLVLFFITDDWIIISDYLSALKGRILRGHFRRVMGVNFLLLGLVGYNLFTYYPWYVGVIAIVIMAPLLVYIFSRVRKFGLRYSTEEWPPRRHED